jgi:hypothetical protein
VPTMRARPVRLLVAALLPAAAWPTLLDMWPNVRSEARQGPACCYHSNHVPPVPRYSTRYSCTAVPAGHGFDVDGWPHRPMLPGKL